MQYRFPHITHLDDVRQAIEGRNEFVIAERPWGYVVNYLVSMPDTFPEVRRKVGDVWEQDYIAALRRELRGILFFPNGMIMARRLHKFFNVGERDETQPHLIDLSQPHVILEKLDGSMITPVETADGFTWGTKMGPTDVAGPVAEWVQSHLNYLAFAQTQMQLGFTPIFEWCSRKQRIVVDYPEDRLVLIAIRNTVTGEYVSLDTMQDLAEDYEIDIVKTYPGTAASLEHLMTETRDAVGIEGWIIRFDDGHMLKLKAEEYLRFHKTKESIALEKNVVDLLINENIDDAKAFMQDEDRHRVEQFETQFWQGIAETVQRYEDYFQTMSGLDRKTWAVEHMPTVRKQNPFTPAIMFGMYDGKDARKLVLDTIKKNCNTQTKVDEVRILWGGARWNYHFNEEG
jgi:RNA ligase